jgi:hypothetical protein
MSKIVLKFPQRVNEMYPEISVDALLALWEEPKIPVNDLEQCKHVYIKGGKANTQCNIKVKGCGEYCSKHKPKPKQV